MECLLYIKIHLIKLKLNILTWFVSSKSTNRPIDLRKLNKNKNLNVTKEKKIKNNLEIGSGNLREKFGCFLFEWGETVGLFPNKKWRIKKK